MSEKKQKEKEERRDGGGGEQRKRKRGRKSRRERDVGKGRRTRKKRKRRRDGEKGGSPSGRKLIVTKPSFSVYTCVCVHVHTCIQSYLTLCNPMDCRRSGSSVHEVFQARILEQGAISSSRSSQTRNRIRCLLCLLHWQVDSLLLRHLGSP